MLTLFVVACSSKEELKTVSMDDLIESSADVSPDSLVDKQIERIPLQSELQTLVEAENWSPNDVVELDSIMFVDRFDVEQTHKYIINTANNSVYWASWKFKTSSQALNAFVNWTQCYGKQCKTLMLTDTISVSVEKMGMLLVENEFYYWNNISEEQYLTFGSSLLDRARKPKKIYAFYQNGKKSVTWFQPENFEK